MRACIILLALLVQLFCSPASAQVSVPGKRHHAALIIGNTAYSLSTESTAPGKLPRLPNACSDAQQVAARFEIMWAGDSDIDLQCDLSVEQMILRIRAFVKKVQKDPLSIAVFYFSGHAVQVRNRQFIFGVDATPDLAGARSQIDRNPFSQLFLDSSVDVYSDFIQKVGSVNEGGFTVFIDACRSDPLLAVLNAGAVKRASAPTLDTPLLPGILLALSTQNGETASDGGGAIGPYADALSANLQKEVPISTILFKVKKAVFEATSAISPLHPQNPTSSDGTAFPCFAGCEKEITVAPNAGRPVPTGMVAPQSPFRFAAYMAGAFLNESHSFSTQARKPAPKRKSRAPDAIEAPSSVLLFEDRDLANTRQSNALSAEVFWCQGGPGSEERRALASKYGAFLVSQARKAKGRFVTIYLKSLSQSGNSPPGNRYLDNYVVADPGDVREVGIADQTMAQGLGGIRRLISRNTPNYVSIFICKYPAGTARKGVVFWQVAAEGQKELASRLINMMDEKAGGFKSVSGIEVVPISPTATEVRYYYPSDNAVAYRLADSLQLILSHTVTVKYFPRLESQAPEGNVEVWIGTGEGAADPNQSPPPASQVPSRNRVIKVVALPTL